MVVCSLLSRAVDYCCFGQEVVDRKLVGSSACLLHWLATENLALKRATMELELLLKLAADQN